MTDAIPDPKAVLPRLPVFFAAIATALILAVLGGHGTARARS